MKETVQTIFQRTIYLFYIIFLFNSINAEVGKYKSKDGTEIAYTVQGKGEIALVFVHGWSCDRSYWENQIDEFSEEYKVVTLDLAGHGDSGIDRKDYTLELFGLDVCTVVDKLNLEKVILIGHSMGGGVILNAYAYMPEKVVGLIGVDTFRGLGEKNKQEDIEVFLKPFKENFKVRTAEFVKSMFIKDSDSTIVEKIVVDMANAPMEVAISSMENAFSFDETELLKNINVPVISINSDFRFTNSEANKKLLKSFELKTLNNCGHFLMIEKPNEFNSVLKESILELAKK